MHGPMDRSTWSVRRYLTTIAIFAVVALGVGCWYGYAYTAGKARSLALTELGFQSDRAAESLTEALEVSRATVRDLATQPGLETVFATRDNGCQLTVGGAGAFRSVRLDIISAEGTTGCSSGKAPVVFAPHAHRGSGWLRQALAATSTTVVWDARDAVTGDASVVITAPVVAGGAPVGAIALFLHLPQVGAALAHDFAGPGQAAFTLIDVASRGVLSTSQAGVYPARPVLDAAPAVSGQRTAADGTQRLFSSARVVGSGWRVYAGLPRDNVLAAARGGLLRSGSVGLVALLLLGCALWLLNRRVAGPLREVTAAVVAAGRDPDARRVTPGGTAELVTLAGEVNAMLDVRAGHEAQLVHQATHDPLTGLANKLLLRDRLEQALRHRSAARVAVVSLGVDRFKTLNDALGPDVADRILVELADRLSRAVRPGDTLARFGGDQFVVLCQEVDDSDDAVRLTERLLTDALGQPFRGPAGDVVLSATAGLTLAHGHEPAATAEQLIREADSAMHQAKAKRARWRMFDQSQQVRATALLETEHALRQAIDEGQLRVHYQPLVDLATGTIIGAEALVRWEHPTRGLVPPMEFIPVAEETGQIVAIGSFVLTEACAQAARWNQTGLRLRVSVNVAVGQLRTTDFAGTVQHALSSSGLAASQLCLEVTESAMMRAAGDETQTMEKLRHLGVHLAIDDFGTGYSSLAYLHQLPVDELKIDRSFINRMVGDPRDAHLVEAIIGMARALGLEVVAEGVETTEQLDTLKALGCGRAQGYLFAPPGPAEQTLAMVAINGVEPTEAGRGIPGDR